MGGFERSDEKVCRVWFSYARVRRAGSRTMTRSEVLFCDRRTLFMSFALAAY